MELLLIPLMAAIQWCRGWGPTDPPNNVNPPAWRRWADEVTADWACGLAVIIALLPFTAWENAVAAGILYFCAEYWFEKRTLFACWNKNLTEYDNGCAWYKLPVHMAVRLFRPLPNKLFATIYGTVAGLAWATMLLPFIAVSYTFAAAIGLCCSFGIIYYAMNLLPDPVQQGESVGRAIYGLMLGLAFYGVL